MTCFLTFCASCMRTCKFTNQCKNWLKLTCFKILAVNNGWSPIKTHTHITVEQSVTNKVCKMFLPNKSNFWNQKDFLFLFTPSQYSSFVFSFMLRLIQCEAKCETSLFLCFSKIQWHDNTENGSILLSSYFHNTYWKVLHKI